MSSITSTAKAPISHRLFRSSGVSKTASGGAIVLGLLYGAYSFLIPHIEIDPGSIGSDSDAYQTEFIFKNTGHFPIRDVTASCTIFAGGRKYESEHSYIADAARPPVEEGFTDLLPGKEVSRNCGGTTERVPFPAAFDIGLSFEGPLHLWRIANPIAHFISIRDQDGHIRVQADSR